MWDKIEKAARSMGYRLQKHSQLTKPLGFSLLIIQKKEEVIEFVQIFGRPNEDKPYYIYSFEIYKEDEWLVNNAPSPLSWIKDCETWHTRTCSTSFDSHFEYLLLDELLEFVY